MRAAKNCASSAYKQLEVVSVISDMFSRKGLVQRRRSDSSPFLGSLTQCISKRTHYSFYSQGHLFFPADKLWATAAHHPLDGFVDRLHALRFLRACDPSYRALTFTQVGLPPTGYISLLLDILFGSFLRAYGR